MLLNQITPVIDSQLDHSQAGFRYGPDEQIYALHECLRLRRGRPTFCAFIDVKNAFGTCWVNAALSKLHRGGVQGQLWKVVADLCTQGRSSVRVHGGLSSFGFDSGLGQGRVLSPLLFNIVVNGAAAAIRRSCPGVSLGPEPDAPRVSTLLYADDLCILAETPEELQRALDSLSEWARAWRFEFAAGEDKSAVMIVGGRPPSMQPFRLGPLELPFVTS